MTVTIAAAGLANLGWLNLLVADMQTGFGPFISVRLTVAGWNTEQIGAVLSAGTVAAVLAQVPAGILVDYFANKRLVAAAGIVGTMLALLLIAMHPTFVPVLIAEIASGFTGAVLVLGIAAITLTLTSRAALGERLGSNVRFAAIGAASGSVLLGLVGSWFSPSMVFVAAAACGVPALFVLSRLPGPAMLRRPRRTVATREPPPQAKRWLLRNRQFLAFIACCAAFHLANAAQLPLAATEAAHRAGSWADIVTGAAITEPQIMVALVSPWVGRLANRRGRRFVLLVGFCALPARALLFALSPTPEMVIAAQLLDGVSAAVFGVLLPLVVADITHGGGRFNFALGLASVACALGAAVSNAAAGALAQKAGLPVAFLALAAIGAGALALVWFIMPETAHVAPAPDPDKRQQPA
jgi:MFS family permease